MSHHIPRVGFLLSTLLVIAAIPFLYFVNVQTGGPRFTLSDSYELELALDDAQQLRAVSPVLQRGVQVGAVAKVELQENGRTMVTVELDDREGKVYRDATMQLGSRSLLAEPFLELDPGHRAAGLLPSGSRLPRRQVFENTEIEEALTALDEEGHADLRAFLSTQRRATQSRRYPEQGGAALVALRRLASEVRRTTEAVRGQEDHIRGLVTHGSAVLGELAAREQSLNEIVSGGRVTLEAIAARDDALQRGLVELPRLLRAGEVALARARPLLHEAQPLVGELRTAAPELSPALRRLRPAAADLSDIVDSLPRFVDAAVPTLRLALPVVERARPVARRADPALRNLVPAVRHIAPYKKSIASFFANTYDGIASKDRRGYVARLHVFDVPLMSQGIRDPERRFFHINNYAPPDDLLAPIRPGFQYPRLVPFPQLGEGG